MTRAPETLAIIDAGGATTSVSLVARVAGQWRLLGTLAGSAGTPEMALLSILTGRVRDADPEFARHAELREAALDDMPQLVARTHPPETLAVVGATRRTVDELSIHAHRTGWRVAAASTETHDPREMMELILQREVTAVLIGIGEPPGADERAALDDLAALAGSAARRRPELRLLLSGALRARRSWLDALGEDPPGDPARITAAPVIAGRRGTGDDLRVALERLLDAPDDGRHAARNSAESLAELLDRRIELLDIGYHGGARYLAEPGVAGSPPTSVGIVSVDGGLVPAEPDDEIVDSVLAWSTGSLDRHRMTDRLRDLRRRPWVDRAGEGARLRLAAASAALTRLAALTPDLGSRAAPDVTILSGGAFATAPPSAVMLTIADTIRRVGATQVVLDHGRLLGPIGTIEDANERRLLLSDLVRDALVPLGSLVIGGGQGARPARRRRSSAAFARLSLQLESGAASGSDSSTTVQRDLDADEVAFVDLLPGARARALLEFGDVVRFGRRTRRVNVSVIGGLAGLVVDLRDVPLNLPERRDRRRARLADWSAQAWPRDER
ncbi:MAG: hypothetical protein ABI598_00235 [Chloroflexota bacterium]